MYVCVCLLFVFKTIDTVLWFSSKWKQKGFLHVSCKTYFDLSDKSFPTYLKIWCTFLSRTVMLILIFNSTAYCHAHSFILYILCFISYFLFILILCILVLYSTIFALSMERTWLIFHCWLYTLCIVVYVTNKTWTWKPNCFTYVFFFFNVIQD